MIHVNEDGRKGPTGSPALHQHVGLPFPTSDAILLCCFGPDVGGTRTHAQLHTALLSAGYVGPQARHLIRTSPLLRRLPGSRYQLRRLQLPNDPGMRRTVRA